MSNNTSSPSVPVQVPAVAVSAEKDAVLRPSPCGVDEEGTSSPTGNVIQPPISADERARMSKEYTCRVARKFVSEVSGKVMQYMSYSYRMTATICDLERALVKYAAEETRGVPKYWKDAIGVIDDEKDEDWNEDVEMEDCEIPDDFRDVNYLSDSDSEEEGPLVMDVSFCNATAKVDAEGPKRFFESFPPATEQEDGMLREEVVALWDDVMSNDYRSYVRPSTSGDLEASFFNLLHKALDAYVASALVMPRNLDVAFEQVDSSK